MPLLQNRHLISLAASIEVKCRRFDAARRLLQHGLQQSPRHVPYLLSQAILEVEQGGNLSAGRALLQRALAANPKNATVLQVMRVHVYLCLCVCAFAPARPCCQRKECDGTVGD
jgi:predicted Zn-dependent protease